MPNLGRQGIVSLCEYGDLYGAEALIFGPDDELVTVVGARCRAHHSVDRRAEALALAISRARDDVSADRDAAVVGVVGAGLLERHHLVALVGADHDGVAVLNVGAAFLPDSPNPELLVGAPVPVASPGIPRAGPGRADLPDVVVGAAEPPAGLVLEGHDVAAANVAAAVVDPEDLSAALVVELPARDEGVALLSGTRPVHAVAAGHKAAHPFVLVVLEL